MNQLPLRSLRFARLRSLLIVAGHPSDIDRAVRSGADALILDAVEPGSAWVQASLERARRLEPARPLLVRTALGSPRVEADLDAIMPGRPDAIVLPACDGGADLQQLGVKLAVREAERGLAVGSTSIVAHTSAAGLLGLASFVGASPRLVALAVDAAAVKGDDTILGDVEHPVEALAQALLLLGARAAGVAAFHMDAAADASSVEAAARRARSMGFAGCMTREVARVATINAAFGAVTVLERDGSSRPADPE